MLSKLWEEYFAEECARIDTKEEKALMRTVTETQNAANELLTKEGKDAVQAHIEALYELHSRFVKKAFFKGCEFAVSFFLKARDKNEE